VGATLVGLHVEKQSGQAVRQRNGHDLPHSCLLRLSEGGVKIVVTNINVVV